MRKIIDSFLEDLPSMNPFELELVEDFINALIRSRSSGVKASDLNLLLICISKRREEIKEAYNGY